MGFLVCWSAGLNIADTEERKKFGGVAAYSAAVDIVDVHIDEAYVPLLYCNSCMDLYML